MRRLTATPGFNCTALLDKQQSYRFNEELRVNSSEQCGGLRAPQSRCPETFFPGTLPPFVGHVRSNYAPQLVRKI